MRCVAELFAEKMDDRPELVVRIDLIIILLHDGCIPDGFEEYQSWLARRRRMVYTIRMLCRTLYGFWPLIYLERVADGLHRI